MDHQGTRMEHMMDLHELWSEGLRIANTDPVSPRDKECIAELGPALKLLEFYMQSGWDDYPTYGRAINSLPRKAEDITDERQKGNALHNGSITSPTNN